MSTATADGEIAEVGDFGQQVVATGGAMQRIQTQHATAVAVQRPRSLARSAHQLKEEARLSGERFFYGWAAGKERIEGPSIKLANAAARCWGNCAVELLPIQDLPDAWVFTAVFVDLETGFTLPRQFRQSKTHLVYGKHDDARKMDIRFQIGQSKAIRNVILNALPAGLIDAAMDEAKAGVRQRIEKYIAEQEKKHPGKGHAHVVDIMLRDLAKYGATEALVFAKLEIAARSAIDIDRLVILSGDKAALADGEARLEDLYPVSTAGAQERAKNYRPDPPKEPTRVDNGIDEPPDLAPQGEGGDMFGGDARDNLR